MSEGLRTNLFVGGLAVADILISREFSWSGRSPAAGLICS